MLPCSCLSSCLVLTTSIPTERSRDWPTTPPPNQRTTIKVLQPRQLRKPPQEKLMLRLELRKSRLLTILCSWTGWMSATSSPPTLALKITDWSRDLKEPVENLREQTRDLKEMQRNLHRGQNLDLLDHLQISPPRTLKLSQWHQSKPWSPSHYRSRSMVTLSSTARAPPLSSTRQLESLPSQKRHFSTPSTLSSCPSQSLKEHQSCLRTDSSCRRTLTCMWTKHGFKPEPGSSSRAKCQIWLFLSQLLQKWSCWPPAPCWLWWAMETTASPRKSTWWMQLLAWSRLRIWLDKHTGLDNHL